MRHPLHIPELTSIIFELVESRRDLAALALSCKTFRDPALKILWKELTSLEPLIRCLPNHIWGEVEAAPHRCASPIPIGVDEWVLVPKLVRLDRFANHSIGVIISVS